jgi:glutathione reductase (NADPH)
MSRYDFNLFVIGGGSGGVRAARVAAGHGARVGLAEEHRLGGTCVIRGCVPKKLLVYASRFHDDFEDAKGFGWTVGEAVHDWAGLIAAKDREIARLEGLYRRNLEQAGVTIFPARATLADRHTIDLAPGKRRLSADKVLIATGGRPVLADRIDGLEHVITSNEAFHLARLPRRIAIVGGGYIAAEFASIFAGLGAMVTIVYRGHMILRGFDEDLRSALTDAFVTRGIAIVTQRTVLRVEKGEQGLIAHLDDGSSLGVDQVMLAIGRTPNSSGLGLEKAGVELSRSGHIGVDEMSRTSVDNIFAVGDVTDRVNLTPAAIREGHAFADSEFGGSPWSARHGLVPTAVFSTPEIASVGRTESEAREACGEIDVYKTQFRPLKGTLSGRNERMLMKLIVERAGGKVAGCHVLGPDAAEIVQMAAIALNMGARKADFDRTLALHPTAAEELVTMRERMVPTGAAAE